MICTTTVVWGFFGVDAVLSSWHLLLLEEELVFQWQIK